MFLRTRWVWALSMDQSTFDRLTRAVAAGQSRRAFLRRMVGLGIAAMATGRVAQQATAEPAPVPGTPHSTVHLLEPSEPAALPSKTPGPTAVSADGLCIEPSIASVCGCLDPNSQVCCRDEVCTGVCTARDGCCAVSSDTTVAGRGEVCGDHCCHPHLDVAHAGYSECCGDQCCAGHCYGEDLCCPVDQFCAGAIEDRCCAADERCCGAGTTGNVCIPGGADSCCAVDECVVTADACYVSCEAGFCRQHVCNDGAVCCAGSANGFACVAGNCCGDIDCAASAVCRDGVCTALVECTVDDDCTGGDACSTATCTDGSCSYAPLCVGDCAICVDGMCSTDDTLCGLCGRCDAGVCTPVVCPAGYSCFTATGECLGIA